MQVIVGPAGILELLGLTVQGRDCGGLGDFGSSSRGHLGNLPVNIAEEFAEPAKANRS